MSRNKKANRNKRKSGHQNPLPKEISSDQKRRNENAHNQAEHDMMDDAEFTAHHPNDDLDEGETARLGEDRTDLV